MLNLISLALLAAPEPRVVADWTTPPTINLATCARGADGWLVVDAQAGTGRAGVVLRGPWDLDAYAELAVPVRNLSDRPVTVILRVDDDRSEALPSTQHRGGLFEYLLSPGPEPAWLTVPLGDDRPNPLAPLMKALYCAVPPDFVRRGTVRGASVAAISLFSPNPTAPVSFALGPVVARGEPARLRDRTPAEVFPFIDRYGQYRHADWPGKTHDDADLAAALAAEATDLAAHGRPADWDRWGGWEAGPRLAATGYFRTEQVDGRWWLVDPDGRLFWSHGVVRVGTRVRVGTVYRGTPLDDREDYFELPPAGSPLARFYDTEPQASRGYYVGREGHRVYDYLEANLARKYGDDWATRYADQAQRRLASWGLNTIANSSDPAVYSQRRTPYTAVVYSAPLGRAEHRIEASGGDWGKLPDPFDPGLGQVIERTLRSELGEVLGDPWCLGFFVDNELAWGDSCHVAEACLRSPAGQPGKQAFLADLRARYGDIAALNAAWHTAHGSWDALAASTTPPDRAVDAARHDLEAFSQRLVTEYFRVCRAGVKAASPHHLYLGCRFAGGGNPLVMRAAAQACDVVSINRYARSLTDLRLPDGVDKPILIGEFHFCAPDRVPFAYGLVPVATQADRARSYELYVDSGLRHLAVVGTHWFQFYDQPTSGRFDGENFPTGLLDLCDRPYAEMVAAVRRTAGRLYATRAGRSDARQE